MFRKFTLLLLIVIPVLFLSCIKEGSNDCGAYLEFIFEYNMEFKDLFKSKVDVVDVFIFDKEGKFQLHKQADSGELIEGNRMYLGDELLFGSYQVLTVGGLSDDFCLYDSNGNECVKGVTTLEEVQLALQTESEEISHEFSPLWFGETVKIEYTANLSVWPVFLIQDTNKFMVKLSSLDSDKTHEDTTDEAIPYTFEIITPERAVYGYDNVPLAFQPLFYKPYLLTTGTEPGCTVVGHLNTVRLFHHKEEYILIVRDNITQEICWSYDLADLLEATQSAVRPDGTPLPLQEYLDRKNEWIITLFYKESEGEFAALGVTVEGCDWIIWFHDVEI